MLVVFAVGKKDERVIVGLVLTSPAQDIGQDGAIVSGSQSA
jgi:hypothetical protein